MWDFILTLLLAALVWFTAQFFGRPFRQYFKLRTNARESIDFTANVSIRDIDPARYDGASDAPRNVGVQIGALHETSLPLVSWALKQIGYDLPGAKGAQIGLANSLCDISDEKGLHNWDIEKALNSLSVTATAQFPATKRAQ